MIRRTFFVLCSSLFAVGLFSTELPVNLAVEPIKLELRKRQPNWEFKIISYFESGAAKRVIFYRPLDESLDEPVKEIMYNEQGTTLSERDLTLIDEGSSLALALGTRVVPHGVTEAYFPSGGLKLLAHFDQGLLHGPMILLHPNGQIQEDTHYYQGKKHGKSLSYFMDGAQKEERFYNLGIPIATWSTFSNDGILLVSTPYKNGVVHGKVITRDTLGHLSEELHCFQGLLHNQGRKAARVCYYSDRKLKEKQSFYFGHPVGVHNKYYPSGKLSYRMAYVDGKKEGDELYLFESGAEKGKGRYQHGDELGIFEKKHDNGNQAFFGVYNERDSSINEFYENGNKKCTYTTLDCEVHDKYHSWYENGSEKKNLNFHRGEEEGTQTYFHTNGKKQSEYRIFNGKMQGKYKKWNYEGKLTSFCTYQNGEKESALYEYYDDGKKKIEEHYLEDRLHGPVKAWYPNRQLKLSYLYTNGLRQGRAERWSQNGNRLFFAAYLEGSPEGRVEEWYPNGQLRSITYYKRGRKEKSEVHYYPSGSEKFKANYLHGKLHLEKMEFFKDGSLKLKESYKHGMPVGEHISYFPGAHHAEQTVKHIFRYRKGKMHGLQEIYFKNGEPEAKMTYLDGVLHGNKISWEEVSGEILEESYFNKGRLEGRVFERLPDGREVYIHYVRGMREGAYVEFFSPNDRFGKVKAIEAVYKNDQLEGYVTEYTPEGLKMTSTHYKNNLRDGLFIVFSVEGTLLKSIEYKSGKKHGKWIEFFPSGKLALQAFYQDNHLNGEKVKYFETGQVASKTHYVLGRKHGDSRQWSEDGILLFDGVYVKGLRDGAFNKYYLDGAPKIEQAYRNDLLHGYKKAYSELGELVESYYEDGELIVQ